MTTAANRVQVLNVPLMAPGVCMLCGTAGIDNRTFVDFGKQVEWYGAVYLCSECIKEVAIAVGFIPVAEFDKLLEQLKEIEAKRGLAESRYDGVVSALDQLFANYNRSDLSVDDIVNGNISSIPEPEESRVDSEEPTDGESKTSESTDVEGSYDVLDDSDFDD